VCMVNRNDPTHGHWAIVTTFASPSGMFSTKEFNTNHAGAREGGNIMNWARYTSGDEEKSVRGYIDWYSLLREKA
jgi:hypothetical protein